MYCVETKNLSYAFAPNESILSNLNLQVLTGTIYGFIGPNGAGKTTTLKLILGLIKKATRRDISFWKNYRKRKKKILGQLGSLIEAPSLYSHLSAKENLQIIQRIYQCPSSRIQQVLEQVGLAKTGSKATANFSLGMKQRLSIAMALLNNPALLILDEPTNGLDPNGIIEIRELLMTLNKREGITIIVSSHLLAEIEKFAIHIGILNNGKLKFQGTLQELQEEQDKTARVKFYTNNPEETYQLIRAFSQEAYIENDFVYSTKTSNEICSAINQYLVENGIKVFEIVREKKDLESIFIDITTSKV